MVMVIPIVITALAVVPKAMESGLDEFVIVNKKMRTCRLVDFVVSADYRVKKERWVPRPCQRTEKPMGHESDEDTNFNWRARYSHQRIRIGTEGLGN